MKCWVQLLNQSTYGLNAMIFWVRMVIWSLVFFGFNFESLKLSHSYPRMVFPMSMIKAASIAIFKTDMVNYDTQRKVQNSNYVVVVRHKLSRNIELHSESTPEINCVVFHIFIWAGLAISLSLSLPLCTYV